MQDCSSSSVIDESHQLAERECDSNVRGTYAKRENRERTRFSTWSRNGVAVTQQFFGSSRANNRKKLIENGQAIDFAGIATAMALQ